MRPRSNRGKEVVFTAKASSVPRERGEEDEREEEFESRTAEKPVKEVQVVAHSSSCVPRGSMAKSVYFVTSAPVPASFTRTPK